MKTITTPTFVVFENKIFYVCGIIENTIVQGEYLERILKIPPRLPYVFSCEKRIDIMNARLLTATEKEKAENDILEVLDNDLIKRTSADRLNKMVESLKILTL